MVSVYSGIISLRNLRMVIFLTELNSLGIYSNNVGDSYLEAKTKRKVYIITGDTFGDRKEHTLVIFKALYGLCSSGMIILLMHFTVWTTLHLRQIPKSGCTGKVISGNTLQYTLMVAIVAKNSKETIDILVYKYNFKWKGMQPIFFYLSYLVKTPMVFSFV